ATRGDTPRQVRIPDHDTLHPLHLHVRPRRPLSSIGDHTVPLPPSPPPPGGKESHGAGEGGQAFPAAPRASSLPYGRRASAESSRAFGIRSCLLTPSHISSGQATKIEDSVPRMMPTIIDSAMPCSEPPPYRYSASTVSRATN